MTLRRRVRFRGAGGSATREFERQRRQNIRDDWRAWLLLAAGIAGFFVWSAFASALAGRFLAAAGGVLAGVALALWSLGGHISAFRWWLGAEGESITAKEIEALSADWHCEHDLEHQHGNWDHILVGPTGVFLLDSKLLQGTAAAANDSLRAGRLAFPGIAFRAGAASVKEAIEAELGWRAPWVQAVVVIWGDFPQGRYEEDKVVYIRGEDLRPWLTAQPQALTAPQRVAIIQALRQVRTNLLPSPLPAT